MMKTCKDCGLSKPLGDFYVTKSVKNFGYIANHCKLCSAARGRLQRIKFYHRFWAVGALGSHKDRGIDVSMTRQELEKLALETPNCPRCDTPLKWYPGRGLRHESPTVDRIDNDVGLTAENIEIVCFRCNTAKGPATMKHYLSWLASAYRRAVERGEIV